jgi:hypothetical protein
MSVKVHLPVYLRPYAGDAEVVEVNGETAAASIGDLVARFPDIDKMLFAAPGQLHDYVSVFLDGEFAQGDELSRAVADGAELHLLYLLGGG